MENVSLKGKPDAGKPHVRIGGSDVASATMKRGFLLHGMVGVAIWVACTLTTNVAMSDDPRNHARETLSSHVKVNSYSEIITANWYPIEGVSHYNVWMRSRYQLYTWSSSEWSDWSVQLQNTHRLFYNYRGAECAYLEVSNLGGFGARSEEIEFEVEAVFPDGTTKVLTGNKSGRGIPVWDLGHSEDQMRFSKWIDGPSEIRTGECGEFLLLMQWLDKPFLFSCDNLSGGYFNISDIDNENDLKSRWYIVDGESYCSLARNPQNCAAVVTPKSSLTERRTVTLGFADFRKTITLVPILTVTFDGNGGTVSPATGIYEIGKTYGSMPTPTRDGYSFAGWYTSVSGGTQVAPSSIATSTAKLYAHWSANTYAVALNLNGGNCTGLTSYTYGVGATLPKPTRAGYTFGGWYAKSDFSGTSVTGISKTETGAKTYYAKWEACQYVVQLNANGGACDALDSYTYGVGATLPTPTKNSCEFGGWYDSADFSGAIVTTISSSAQGAKTFYAKWCGRVLFDLLGRGSIVGNSASLEQLIDIGQSAVTPVVEGASGWRFAGWSDDFSSVASNMTVTAQYEACLPDGVYTQLVNNVEWSYVVKSGYATIGSNVTGKPAIDESVEGSVEIPSVLGDCPVTAIGSYALYGCGGLTSVTIPSSVTSIGGHAFYGCSGMNGFVVDLDNPCYKSVNGLLLNKDGTELIAGVNGNVTIPSGVTNIGDGSFYGYSGLTSVTIPSSVTSIGDYAFAGDGKLIALCFMGKCAVESSGYGIFAGADKAIVFVRDGSTGWVESGNAEIPETWPIGDPSAREVRVWETYPELPHFVTFDLGNHCTRTGGGELQQLVSADGGIVAPDIEMAEGWTFLGWSRDLASIAEAAVVNVNCERWNGEHTRYDICTNGVEFLFAIEDGEATLVGEEYWSRAVVAPYGADIVIPAEVAGCPVTSIGNEAFIGGDFRSLFIPASVRDCGTLDQASFGSIVVDEASSTYCSVGGILYDKDMTRIIVASKSIPEHVVVPAGVVEIGYEAFKWGRLTEIELPEGLKSIGVNAFWGCDALTTVKIPASVSYVGQGAFGSCSQLSELSVAEGNTYCCVVDGVLYADDMTRLVLCVANKDSLIIPESVKQMDDSCFAYGNRALKKLYFAGNAPSVSAWSSLLYWTSDELVCYVREGSVGWLSTDSTDLPDTWPVGSSDARAVARWVGEPALTYEVTFDLGEFGTRTGGGELQQTVVGGTSAVAPVVSVAEGLELAGWDKTFDFVVGDVLVQALYKRQGALSDGVNYTEQVGDYIWTFSVINGEAEIGVRDENGNPQWECAVSPNPVGVLTVPDTLGGCPVSIIGPYALYNCGDVETVLLPDALREISDFSLSQCYQLSTLTIPEQVLKIGAQAFSYCYRLETLTIPANVVEIGQGFAGRSGLCNLNVDEGNTHFLLDEGALYDKARTELYYWPRSRKIALPSTVRSVRAYACDQNYMMQGETFVFPPNVTNVEYQAFSSCGLSGVVMNDGLLTIGENAFYDNNLMTYAVIPATVKEISYYVFSCCPKLTSVFFAGNAPEKVEGWFYDGTPDDLITFVRPNSTGWQMAGSDALPDAWPGEGSYARAIRTWTTYPDVSWLVRFDLGDGATRSGGGELEQVLASGGAAVAPELLLEEGCEFYKWSADFTCVSNSLTVKALYRKNGKLSDGVNYTEQVGDYKWTFSIVEGEAEIGVRDESGNAQWACAVSPDPVGTITVPDTLGGCPVTKLGYCTLVGCGMSSVCLPSTLRDIGPYAFCYSSLQTVEIPEGVTSIGYAAFTCCNSLASVIIPSSVTDIGADAFSYDEMLKAVCLAGTQAVETVGSGLFCGSDRVTVFVCAGSTGWSGDETASIPDTWPMGDDYARDVLAWTSYPDLPALPHDVRFELGDHCSRTGGGELSQTIGPQGMAVAPGIEMAEGWTFLGWSRDLASIAEDAVVYVNCERWNGEHTRYDICTNGVEFSFAIEDGEATLVGEEYWSRAVIAPYGADIVIPAEVAGCPVTAIGNEAFIGGDFSSLFIPASVLDCGTLDQASFGSIVVDEASATYCSVGGILYDKDMTRIIVASKSVPECVVVPVGVVEIGNEAFKWGRLTEIELPEGLESIGVNAFWGCDALTTVKIPASVSYVGQGAFGSCSQLSELSVAEGNTYCCVVDGVLYADDMTRLVLCVANKDSLIIPESVKQMDDSCFAYGNRALKKLYFAGNAPSVSAWSSLLYWTSDELVCYVREGSVGWLSTDSTDLPDAWPVGSSDARAVARWDGEPALTYEVTFDLGEHGSRSGGGELQQTVVGGTAAVAPEITVESEGMEFCGWDKSFDFVIGDMTVHARYERTGAQADVLAEAVDCEGLKLSTGGDANWLVQQSETQVGASALRSGAIADSQETWLEATVYGAGTLTFWWKTSSEVYETTPIDVVSFRLDGGEYAHLGGETDWSQVTIQVSGEGAHVLRWTYEKDVSDSAGEDCAWLDGVAWSGAFSAGSAIVPADVTGGKEIAVDESWVNDELTTRFGADRAALFASKFGNDLSKALLMSTGKKAADGTPLCVWQDYVAGTDPTNPESKFTAIIKMEDGEPKVTWDPDLNEEGTKSIRSYTTYGVKELGGQWTDMSNVPETEKSDYKFFKVSVEMP